MRDHAILSASTSNRWINCPPSARLCAEIPDHAGPAAQEGTDAHALGEYKLKTELGMDATDPYSDMLFLSDEMENYARKYSLFVMDQIEEAEQRCPDTLTLIEHRLDFSKWVPEGFGTGDCVIISDGELHIIDLKYGRIKVDAENNSQMMCYTLGALDTYSYLYNIETIRMTIFQPRIDNISTWKISKKDLLFWAENVLRPAAEIAFRGDGVRRSGEHCRFCKVKSNCPEYAEYVLQE